MSSLSYLNPNLQRGGNSDLNPKPKKINPNIDANLKFSNRWFTLRVSRTLCDVYQTFDVHQKKKNGVSGPISIVRKLNVSRIIISPQLIPFEEG